MEILLLYSDNLEITYYILSIFRLSKGKNLSKKFENYDESNFYYNVILNTLEHFNLMRAEYPFLLEIF